VSSAFAARDTIGVSIGQTARRGVRMRLMKTRRLGLATLVVSLLSVLTSCATPTPKASAKSQPDARHGIVYGRIRVDKDGEIIGTVKRFHLISPYVAIHVSPYAGADKLSRNEWAAGKWFRSVSLKQPGDGYFSLDLPVGRYYIVYFIYGEIVGSGSIYMRTYESIPGATNFKPMVMTFDVRPGEATYVGTWLHRFTNVSTWPASADFDLDVLNEFTESQQWLKANFPKLADLAVVGIASRERL
jgi:hypothetical protein